jgi:hypothetical protein
MNLVNYVAAAVMTGSAAASAIAAEPTMWRESRSGASKALIQGLLSPGSMARSVDGSQPVVGSWGDGRVRPYRLGDVR